MEKFSRYPLSGVLAFKGSGNKVPQTQRLKTTEMHSFTVLEANNLKSSFSFKAMLPLKSLEKNSPFPLLWWLLPVLGIPWLHYNLCLCLPMALFTACLRLLPNFPLRRTTVIGFSIQTNLVWLHLTLIASLKTLFTNGSHFQAPGGNLGRHYSTQNKWLRITPTILSHMSFHVFPCVL